MSTTGKEYKLAIRIAGIVDKSYDVALVSASSSLKTFSATMKAVDSDFTKLDKGFNKIMNAGQKCFQAVATAAGVATVAIGAAVAASVKIGSEFEAQMSTVQAISGATASELERLTDKARELGRTSVFSATEVGNAMEYMGMAGWKTDQILDGISGVLALAAASGEDFATVSDIVTDDLTAFNMTAEETERMVNVLAQAAMNSNTTVAKMGETFKYAGAVAGAMNYQIEDMAIATGLMASAGIKESMAGTTLRNIITRMAKPTRESAEAMEALGLSLENDSGEMYSFLDIMKQVRSGMAGMTETQKAYYGAELAGQRGMTGLLAIANASEDEFNELTEAIYNAEGAAELMASIRLDNLSGDVQIFKDTLSDAGIELYYQFNDELRDITQKGTELVKAGSTKIPQMFKKISTEFPTIKRKFTRYAEPVFNVILTVGKWVVQHGSGIISVIAGIGAALAAYKIASTAVHLINALMSLASLNPVTLAILGVVAAIGALTTAITAYKQYERGLIDESLSSHFGSIALSLEEIQKVAEYIVQTGSFDDIKKAMDAFDGLDEYAQTMSDAVSELDKMNWQISIGMKLDEEEQESYKQAIQDYVDAAQNYALQGQYAVSLNLSAIFDTDDLEQSNIVDQINLFYSDKYEDLQELGTKLNEAVTEAFNDGLLEIDEVEKIRQIQQQMAEIQQALALGEYDATLSAIGIEFSGAALDSDTFQNLQEELKTAANDVSDTYRESYRQAQASTNAAYNAGYLTDEQYQAASRQNEATMTSGIAETNLRALRYQINSIYDAYGDEIEQYQQAVQDILSEYGSEAYSWDWQERPALMWDGLIQSLETMGPARADKKAIEELLGSMEDQIAEFEALMEQWDTLSPEVQAELIAIDRDLSTLQGMTVRRGDNIFGWGDAGDINGLYRDLSNQVMDSDYTAIKEWLDDYYEEFLGYSYEDAQIAAQQAASDTQTLIDESFSADFSVEARLAVTLNPYIRNSNWPQGLQSSINNAGSPYNADGTLAGPYSQSYIDAWDAAHRIDHNATGGIIQNKELSWLAENGPEAVVPLDGSRRAVSLWEKAGQLLGMDSILDRYDVSGGGQTVTIDYNPTLQFYGEAPSKDDLTEALRLSQDEFDSMMERYLKTSGRVSFAT